MSDTLVMLVIPVKVLQTDDGGWYVIPEERYNQWKELENIIHEVEEDSEEWYSAIIQFDETFAQFRIGGDLNNIKLYIDKP